MFWVISVYFNIRNTLPKFCPFLLGHPVYICIFEKNEMGGACSIYGGGERRVQGFDGEIWEKRQLGRPRRRWEDNNKMDLQEVGHGGMDWIELVKDRDRWRTLVNSVIKLRVP